MAKKKVGASAKRISDTHVTLRIKGHDASKAQLKDLKSLAMELAPKFLAKIGAPDKKFDVAAHKQGFLRTAKGDN